MDWRFLFTSFKGRIGRRQFWFGAGCLVLATMIISLISGAITGVGLLGGAAPDGSDHQALLQRSAVSGWTAFVLFALLAWPALAISLKRRHDRGSAGRSVIVFWGATSVLWLLQALGIGYSVENFGGSDVVMPSGSVGAVSLLVWLGGLVLLVVMGFLSGEEGPNAYGDEPPE